jgi:hypothetical protein
MGYSLSIDLSGVEEVRRLVNPKQLVDDMAVLHRKLSLMLLAYIIKTMPVDTGRARAGWLALMDKHGISGDRYVQHGAGSTDARSVSEGRRAGEILSDRPLDISVANTVKYVEYLEKGTSRMTGFAFVQKGIDRARTHSIRLLDAYVAKKVQDALESWNDDPETDPGPIR